jgi:hypothetical protein
MAEDYQKARARFYDRIEALNPKGTASPVRQLQYFLEKAQKPDPFHKKYTYIASYCTKLLSSEPGQHTLGRIANYLSYQKGASKNQFEKFSGMSWVEYVNQFIRFCSKDSNISARGLMDYTAANTAPQYVEPNLLYVGDILEKLQQACTSLNAPNNLSDYVVALKDAYRDSGLEKSVQLMRDLASLPEAQGQQRVTIEAPYLKEGGTIRQFGGIIENLQIVLRVDPNAPPEKSHSAAQRAKKSQHQRGLEP